MTGAGTVFMAATAASTARSMRSELAVTWASKVASAAVVAVEIAALMVDNFASSSLVAWRWDLASVCSAARVAAVMVSLAEAAAAVRAAVAVVTAWATAAEVAEENCVSAAAEAWAMTSLEAVRFFWEAASSVVKSAAAFEILSETDSSRSLSVERRATSSFSSSSFSVSLDAVSAAWNSAIFSWSFCGRCSAWRRFLRESSAIACRPVAAMLICSADEEIVRERASRARWRSSSVSFFTRS